MFQLWPKHCQLIFLKSLRTEWFFFLLPKQWHFHSSKLGTPRCSVKLTLFCYFPQCLCWRSHSCWYISCFQGFLKWCSYGWEAHQQSPSPLARQLFTTTVFTFGLQSHNFTLELLQNCWTKAIWSHWFIFVQFVN